ncbi:MAG: trypsin-like peptidase domain-containing protein [Phycisphaerales bacterium]
MRHKLSEYGPSLMVLLAVAAVLFLGPAIVRNFTFARTSARIEQASNRLRQDNILEAINQAHRDIAVKVAPSVAYIATRKTEASPWTTSDRTRISSGSGWVYDAHGHIVTNAHVIDDAQRIDVQMHDGQIYSAEVIGSDLRTDIAVLKVDAANLHPASRSESASLQQGDRVFAFGSPFDFRFSMSQGIVSGIGRDAQLVDVRYQNFIQVDAAINPGNSGGPLANIFGEVVAMNTAIATGRPGSMNDGLFSGIGLAIPMEMIESVVNQLIEKGEVARGFVGVHLREGVSSRALANGFTGDGVEVGSVRPGGPAERAGLRPLDIIMMIDDTRVATLSQLQATISRHEPGETVELAIWRFDPALDQARELTVEVTLDELDPGTLLSDEAGRFLRQFGLELLATASPERAEALGVQHRTGVIVERVNSSMDGRIQPGSIITSIFDQQVRNLDEFYARLERAVIVSPNRINMTLIGPDGRSRDVVLSRDR